MVGKKAGFEVVVVGRGVVVRRVDGVVEVVDGVLVVVRVVMKSQASLERCRVVASSGESAQWSSRSRKKISKVSQ